MSEIEHWIVKSTTGGIPAFVLYDEEAAAGYAAVKEHWNVEGPFVPAEQLQGVVSECERLRVFERAFAKVPQEQQARLMDAVRADAAAEGQQP